MSRPLKKPRAVFPEEEYVSESDEEMEQDEMIGSKIDVDFEGFRAEDNDFHGIKQLIQMTFRGLDVDLSGIADTIISQNYVGSVIKQVSDEMDEDEEEEEEEAGEDELQQVFGVTTVINLTSRKDESCISGLRSALVEKSGSSGSDETNRLLRDILGNESKHVGLLLSERLVNLPPQFALPIFESLGDEVEEAKTKKMPYDFTYLLMICKLYKMEGKKKKKQKQPSINLVMWSNPEEEIFAEECLASFEYEVKGDTGLGGDWEEDDAEYTPYRRVLLLKADKVPSIIHKVKQNLVSCS
ncbi:protein BCCIP homolog [Oratosquilla oratoria]|uniref:protein BCCIP homolog n=1 Tax=Oratosquilla oratoria TaxID=337810 RepID=UPI003F757C11